jgi:coenzyme Q-binding protein COQ10
MPSHSETRLLPYTPAELFDLVAAVEDYPKFLPWCLEAEVRDRKDEAMVADLVIGFRMFRERFTSDVSLHRPERIDVRYRKGPLRHLNNRWVFEPHGEGQCMIDFHVDFEFRSRVLQKLIGVLFHEAFRRMVGAFEARARVLYGKR